MHACTFCVKIIISGPFLDAGLSRHIYVPVLSRRQACECILHIPIRFKGELTCALVHGPRAHTHLHAVYGQTGICACECTSAMHRDYIDMTTESKRTRAFAHIDFRRRLKGIHFSNAHDAHDPLRETDALRPFVLHKFEYMFTM